MARRRGRAAPLAGLLIALLVPAVALAGGPEDGEAGLNALQRGDYRGAVDLFTRALQDRSLIPADRALAHLSRGKAWLALGERDKALVDLRRATALEPGDADAQAALREALNAGAPEAEGRPAMRRPPSRPRLAADPWGLLETMAGRYYWYEVPGAARNAAYLHFEWVTPGKALAYSLHDKSRATMVGLLTADPDSGRILGAAVVKGKARYETIEASAGDFDEYGFLDGVAVRETSRAGANGTIDSTTRAYQNGVWRDYTSAQLVETSTDELMAAGILKPPKNPAIQIRRPQ